jgi:hypothetical protein
MSLYCAVREEKGRKWIGINEEKMMVMEKQELLSIRVKWGV